MFEGIRKKIGEAIEKVEDGFKNVITLGKHEKIKEKAKDYENTLSLLKTLQNQNTELVTNLETILLDFEEQRNLAIKACQECQATLAIKAVEISFSFPEIKPPPENDISIYKEGILDSKLQDEYKANKVGAASKGYIMYMATHKKAQQQMLKHPLIAVGAALIDGINGLVSATKAATAQLKEIVEMQSQANKYVYEYRKVNQSLSTIALQITEDKGILLNQLDVLNNLKEQFLKIHDNIYVNPNTWKKIMRWWRKLFRLNIYSKKELKRLGNEKVLILEALTNISLVLQKNYVINE